ncbi:NAD(P)H-hydrate dehydratase [soil metagenome]
MQREPLPDISTSDIAQIDAAMLRTWPLPVPSADGDKETRGHVLIIGGSVEMPGAIILAATAALRAGAGKLSIATVASIAPMVASAIPDSRVVALEETAHSGVALEAVDRCSDLVDAADAILIGPGMQDENACCEFTASLCVKLDQTKLILDACAMPAIRSLRTKHKATDKRPAPPILLTPHAGEMAHLTGADKQALLDNPEDAARNAAREWNALVALKGANTVIAAPDGRAWLHAGGDIGLAVSGSGDTLAGIIAGLAARGAPLEQAAAWGVFVHASAGESLSRQFGRIGYLAREIPGKVPRLLERLGRD